MAPRGSALPAIEHATLEEALPDGIKLEGNAYMLCHGWTCAPLLMQFVAHFLKPLQAAARTVEELAQDTGAAIGPLLLLLRTCRILGYLQLDSDSLEYCIVPGAELTQLEKYLHPDSESSKALRSIYVDAVPPFRVPSAQASTCMSIWKAECWSETASKTLAVLFDGAVLTPLLASITYFARSNEEGCDAGLENLERIDFRGLGEESRSILGGIFEEVGVGQMDLEGVVTMTEKGSAALRKCYSYYMPTSHASALANFHHILFRDTGNGYVSAETDLAKRHIFRLIGSRGHQQKLLHDLTQYISAVFGEEDFAKQPSFVVDSGSSDAHLLTHIYELMKSDTPRGKALQHFPVTVVCANSSEEILASVKAHLDKHAIPNVTIRGDAGRPDDVLTGLCKNQIDPKKCLHVRAFADHRLPATPCQRVSGQSSVAVFARAHMGDLVYLDTHGAPITALQAFTRLTEHFERWANVLDGSHGLCLIEDMMLDLPTTVRFFNDNTCFGADIVRTLSRQYNVSPVAFAMAAAMAGLFPRNLKNVKTYPKRGNYCQTMAQHLVKRPFRIRLAEKSDLPELVRLETLTWEKHLQVSEKVLSRRLKTSPTTVLVLVVDDKLVGVLYMQKIESLNSIDRQRLAYVHETHDPEGSLIQLISININPKYASMAIGSDLRGFALHLAHLDASIKNVVAVTRCRDFKGYLGSLQTYVDSHVSGRLIDPILDFHTSYGAKVQRLVEGFRPEDTDNHGTGVLIQYSVNDVMVTADAEKKSSATSKTNQSITNGVASMQNSAFDQIKALMAEWGYTVDDDDLHRGFFDYGMDSVEIQAVRNKLSDMVGYELPVSTLLDYPSVSSLSEHLDSLRGYAPDATQYVQEEPPSPKGLGTVSEESEMEVDMESVPSTMSSEAAKSMFDAVEHGIRLATNAAMLAHGWTCGPLLLEFVSSFLGPLRRSRPDGATAADLARHTGAALGPLTIVLRTCSILEYVELDDSKGKYKLVEGLELSELEKYLDPSHPISETIDSIYAEATPPFRMDSKQAKFCLRVWKDARQSWSRSPSKPLRLLLDGIVLTPLLASITYYGFWNGEGFKYNYVDFDSRKVLASIFEESGVGSMSATGNLTMTSSGSTALKRCYSYFVPTSYAPMLSNFNHILFADAGWGFVGTLQDIARTAIHVESLFSVVNSGLPNLNLFNDMMHHIGIVFAGEEFASQPSYIADAGSGDGYLLLHAFDFIKNKTPRGRVLAKYPLTMIGIEYDEEAKTLLKLKLSQKSIPNIVIIGNVGNPAGIVTQLKQNSIDPSKVLHVRAFVDHDRPYVPPAILPHKDSAAAAFAKETFADIIHLDKHGAPVTGLELYCSWTEHFRRWAGILKGTHGLCVLEEMMLNVATTKRYMNENVSLHFDITQCLARHHIISPAAFAMSAANEGLFPKSFKTVKSYPELGPYCRIVNVHLMKRPFSIRLAELTDMPALLKLEALAWEKHMQASKEVLTARLKTSPTTCFVSTVDGVVVGVLYTQRIPGLDTVNRQKFMRISDAHDPNGSVIQLIAINVDPEYKTMGIGSELRAFALYMARVESSISSVCAVTLFRDYRNFKGNMQAYLDKHLAGKLTDPILGFHTGYGAVVHRLVPNFRPEDTDNRATGVLIEYNILEMSETPQASGKRSRKNSLAGIQEQKAHTITILKPILAKCGYEVTDDTMDTGFFGEVGFGMDSLDSVHVLHELSSKVGFTLETTLLFDYPTARSLCQQLDKVRKVEDKPSQVMRLPKNGDPFIRQSSLESAFSNDKLARPRSDSIVSSGSKLAGQVRSWEKMSARELLEIQDEIRRVLVLPRYQARFAEIARQCYPDFIKYTYEIEPILCEVEGPVYMRHGYIEDDTFEIVQKNRPLFFSRVFLKYCHNEPEVKRLGHELVRLTGQDQSWPADWAGGMDEAVKLFGRIVGRKQL